MMRRPCLFLCTTLLCACGSTVDNARVATVMVNGNCGMCEETIEAAVPDDGLAEVDWDRKTRLALVTFDSTRTTLDAVLKQVAQAGYDNERWTAPDAAYDELPHCCHYKRTGTAISAPKPSEGMTDH
jgi:copper chaperone CopZ